MSISQPKCALKCKLGIEYGAFFGADVAQCLLDFSQIICIIRRFSSDTLGKANKTVLNYKRIPLSTSFYKRKHPIKKYMLVNF